MLPKESRLKKTKDIEGVFRRGEGRKEGFLFLKLAENNLGVSRFAFIVSKKVAKKAVVRNKIKRILRAVIRTKLPDIKTGFDVAIIVSRGFGSVDPRIIKEIVEKLFKKAKLI